MDPNILTENNAGKEEQSIQDMFWRTEEEGWNLVNSSKGKDIIVLIGYTGAGKTTLASYLTKKKLKFVEDDYQN